MNLNTGREGFVETLRQHVEVDVFGSCYPDSHQCGKESAGDCWDLLASRCRPSSCVLSSCHVPRRRYKFYLSLENSICKLNGVDMSTVAPPNSSIDIKDFPSFEGLSQRQCWILL